MSWFFNASSVGTSKFYCQRNHCLWNLWFTHIIFTYICHQCLNVKGKFPALNSTFWCVHWIVEANLLCHALIIHLSTHGLLLLSGFTPWNCVYCVDICEGNVKHFSFIVFDLIRCACIPFPFFLNDLNKFSEFCQGVFYAHIRPLQCVASFFYRWLSLGEALKPGNQKTRKSHGMFTNHIIPWFKTISQSIMDWAINVLFIV